MRMTRHELGAERVNTHRFANGFRIIQVDSPTNVVYCGIGIGVGSRHEQTGEEGMAHFCEHMLFKGTERRKAWHILNRMEAVGGDLNAYTNKEETVVYAAFMREHLARALDLLFDVVFHSTYPQHEIDKECEVVADEIESYNDSPAELIFDRFEDLIHQGSSLGHNILGTADNVRRFTTADTQNFVQRLYAPERMVLFVFGHVNFERVKRLAASHLENVKNMCIATANKMAEKAVPSVGMHVEERGTHQAHVMTGCAAYGAGDERRVALYFLNNLLGGPGMNSRLNIALREHGGLVYTVESTLTNYTDTSTWGIYFGCDAHDVDRCLRMVRRELDGLCDTPLSERQFRAALKQIKGQIGVACDNFESFALDTAKAYLHYHRFESPADTMTRLERLTPALLQEVAREVFAEERMTTLMYI